MNILMVILPVFCIYALGYGGYFFLKPDIPNLARFAVYLLLPLLCFDTFYRHELSFSDVYLIGYTVGLTYLLIGLVYILGRLFSYRTGQVCSVILGSVFMNSGNYGIPVVLLAFGEAGRPVIIFLTVFHGVLQATIGVYYAAKGGGGSAGVRGPLGAVARMPVLYAIIAGIVLQKLGVHIPENLMLCVSMVGDASIPVAMIILGMQLATISLTNIDLGRMVLATALKLVVSPVIAWLLTLWMPVDPLVKQIFILTAGMPTAANTTMLAVQFNSDPKFVSGVTFISTLLSIPTVSFLLYLAQSGVF